MVWMLSAISNALLRQQFIAHRKATFVHVGQAVLAIPSYGSKNEDSLASLA